jgi:hypothetical protein
MLAGNIASILTGGAIAVGASLIWPDDFDFASTRALNAPPGSRFVALPASVERSREDSLEKDEKSPTGKKSDSNADVQTVHELDESELDPAPLQQAFRFACWCSVILVGTPSPRTGRWLTA